jgi:hypothetical protein
MGIEGLGRTLWIERAGEARDRDPVGSALSFGAALGSVRRRRTLRSRRVRLDGEAVRFASDASARWGEGERVVDTGKKKFKGDLVPVACEIMLKRRDLWDKSDLPMNSSPQVLIYVDYLDTVQGIEPTPKLIICDHYSGEGHCELRASDDRGCIYAEGFKPLRDLSARQPDRPLSKEIQADLARHRQTA